MSVAGFPFLQWEAYSVSHGGALRYKSEVSASYTSCTGWGSETLPSVGIVSSADCKRGLRKGATSKNVKCQKVFRHFSTFFAQCKKRQKSSKKVKKFFRHFSTNFARHHFSGPFWGALISVEPHIKYDGQHWY